MSQSFQNGHSPFGVSVIVPVYNAGQSLPRCIDSILNQSFTNFELLLVDDGSTDGSGAICDAYAARDSRIRVFHKENGGVASARNAGLDKAVGDWVTFVDSDDYVLDDYFPYCMEENIDLCIQNWRYGNGEVIQWHEARIVDGEGCRSFLAENIHTEMFRMVWGLFFRRKILVDNNIRFDVRFRLGEDTLFVMDYYKFVKSIQLVDNSCYIYDRQDNWHNKYGLSFCEAMDYLDVFMNRYDQLPVKSVKLSGFVFSFIKRVILTSEKSIRIRWALAKPVLRYKKCQLPYKGVAYKLKFYLAKALSNVVNV